MKKYTITALILTLIAGICAALIASINLLTAPIIEKNNDDKKANLCKEIFDNYDAEHSKSIDDVEGSIKEKIEAYDASGAFIGYIYTVDGSNAYGQIVLLVGITKDLKLAGVEFLTNGQSFSSEAETHLETQYKDNMTEDDILGLDLTKSDVTAGATYASKLIRSLVSEAFEDAKGGNQ